MFTVIFNSNLSVNCGTSELCSCISITDFTFTSVEEWYFQISLLIFKKHQLFHKHTIVIIIILSGLVAQIFYSHHHQTTPIHHIRLTKQRGKRIYKTINTSRLYKKLPPLHSLIKSALNPVVLTVSPSHVCTSLSHFETIRKRFSCYCCFRVNTFLFLICKSFWIKTSTKWIKVQQMIDAVLIKPHQSVFTYCIEN